MGRLALVEIVGYVASVLVFATFYMKTMIPLRAVAIGSNVAFLAYGLAGGLYPIFVLHLLLLPLNCLRLQQMRSLIGRVRQAAHSDLSMDWLVPLMSKRTHAPGEVLFKMGDAADSLCVVLAGSVRIAELDIVLGPGAVIGEIGLFAPDQRRTGTAVCETAVELGVVANDKVLQLYFQNPRFGFALIRLVIGRLLENEGRLRAQLAALSSGPGR